MVIIMLNSRDCSIITYKEGGYSLCTRKGAVKILGKIQLSCLNLVLSFSNCSCTISVHWLQSHNTHCNTIKVLGRTLSSFIYEGKAVLVYKVP